MSGSKGNSSFTIRSSISDNRSTDGIKYISKIYIFISKRVVRRCTINIDEIINTADHISFLHKKLIHGHLRHIRSSIYGIPDFYIN
jgi:hypothetical protein